MADFIKDPDARLDYTVDWTDWLNDVSDYITSAKASAQTGVTIDASAHTSLKHTVFLSGGTVGTEYNITSRIWTNGGRKDDRSFTIYIEEK